MEDLKQIIAKNISELRTDRRMTQLELAEKLNYSDKAISKWERAESIPDVITLKAVAELFGVSVDYILSEHTQNEKPPIIKANRNNRLIITLISVVAVWLLATCAYAFGWFFSTHLWMAFIVAVPVSMIVLLVFNSIWGKRILNMFIISGLVWSIFLTLFLGFFAYLNKNIWMIFLIGIPAQVVIFLCFGIKSADTYKMMLESPTPEKTRKRKLKKSSKAAEKDDKSDQ